MVDRNACWDTCTHRDMFFYLKTWANTNKSAWLDKTRCDSDVVFKSYYSRHLWINSISSGVCHLSSSTSEITWKPLVHSEVFHFNSFTIRGHSVWRRLQQRRFPAVSGFIPKARVTLALLLPYMTWSTSRENIWTWRKDT